MGNYGLKIANDGYGITETDPRRFAFWSKYQTVKIFKQGSGTATMGIGVSEIEVNIAHGLSFIPMYLLYSQLNDGSGKWFLNRTKMTTGDADADEQYVHGGYSGIFPGPWTELGLYINATNLHLHYKTYDNSVAHDIDYYYYIFGDKGGL